MSLVKIRKLSELSATEQKQILYRQGLDLRQTIEQTIEPMADEFEKNPLEALKFYSNKFDGSLPSNLLLEGDQLRQAIDRVNKQDDKIIPAFEQAIENIRSFHEKQKPVNFETEIAGNTLGYRFQPFDRVALYVPGGKALYPTTVMMGVIPALIAGVKDIIILSPPNRDLGQVPDVVQAVASLAGADRMMQAGGAQSVLAMAYGLEEYEIAPVDFIYGPGNIYVAAAKSYVAAKSLCGIDSFAGPSEVVIIADHTANPYYLAHDLLAQAEHDEDATSILLCTDRAVAEEAGRNLEKAIAERDSDRKNITRESIRRNGFILLVENIQEAIKFSNDFAPEHLEIQTAHDDDVLAGITAAGSIFVGPYAPVAVGDYYSGTNHILPTNRAARFSSGVSVHSFFRRITWQKCTEKGLSASREAITVMSRVEGLFDEHGYSVLARFKNKP